MINLNQLKKFCCEDISLIENYDKAICDNTKYDCHHRLETDKGYTKQDLIEMGLYYKRPANELILLTHGEHTKLHHTGKTLSEEAKQKLSIAHKGKPSWRKGIPSPMKGKHHSKETKRKMSESLKDNIPWNKGKTDCYSEEAKRKMSEANKGKPKQKYVWLTPDDNLVIMSTSRALNYHPDWIRLEQV